jgi:CheY-like chemotaxis protein
MKPPSPESLPPLRIFVVENHADTLKYLRLYLEQLNHVVESAQTMGEALTVLAREKFDVLISDIGLPDGDGWELLRRAGPSRPDYAIAMSGFGLSADRTKSREAGFRNHLLKPFMPDDLARNLEEAAAERAGSGANRGSPGKE